MYTHFIVYFILSIYLVEQFSLPVFSSFSYIFMFFCQQHVLIKM